MNKPGFSSLGNLLDKYKIEDKQRRISQEFQDYAYRLAVELSDTAHTSIYMRMCKNTPRFILEEARIFVKGAVAAKSKAKLYMWKVKQMKDEIKEKKDK